MKKIKVAIIGSGNIVTTYIRRHETSSTYDYLGFAPTGTAESTATWTLTRLTLSNTGTSAVMHATDSWNNRVTATYI
jgi:acetaldehyde dehydrogenase (acetylating)